MSSGWIGTNNVCIEKEIIMYRKEFFLDSVPSSLLFHISADAKYKLFVNGFFMNIGPQKGDSSIWFYDTLEVSASLVAGRNVILVHVMQIPDKSDAGNASFFRTGTPGLYLVSSDGSVAADATWMWKKAQIRLLRESEMFSPLQMSEEVSVSPDVCGVFSAMEGHHWRFAQEYTMEALAPHLQPQMLIPRTIPLMKMEPMRFGRIEKVRASNISLNEWNRFLRGTNPVTIPPHSREIIDISAEVERTGFLNLLMRGGEGSTIRILCSECYAYDPDEELEGFFMPKKGDRTDSENGKLFGFTDTYRVEGDGNSHAPHMYQPFWFRTFRYVELIVETSDIPLTLTDFTYTTFNYPLEAFTTVETSDETLKEVWEISERTLRLCMHETYEDCPFYEQLQYAMDSRSQILYTYALSADDRLARQCMDDFRRSVKPDGLINCSYPNYEHHIIPGFAIYYIGMVYDHMMYYGDVDLVRAHLPVISGILDFFRRNIDSSGLVGKIGGPLFQADYWSFIDWTPQWKETMGVPPATNSGPLTMESLLYIQGLQYAAALLEFVGAQDDAAPFRSHVKEMQHAVNSLCRDSSGMYLDGPGIFEYSQHAQVFAVLTGTVSQEEGRRLLVETFTDSSRYAPCSVAMMYYLFRALEACDLYEKTHELWNIWREMVRKNLSTCEEDSVLSRSDCHAWGALALYELPSAVLGIRPKAPGFSSLEIHPLPGVLQWAKGSVITPRGSVDLEWVSTDGKMNVKARIPHGIEVETDSGVHKVDITRYDSLS